MEIQHLSKQYSVRNLRPVDAKLVHEVLKSNTIFYQYHPPMVTVESILEDMEALPPNKGYEEKHYIGFFHNATLVAVMDFIENYPHPGTALIGFFAMNTKFQGKGIGTAIISDCVDSLTKQGFEKVRLGIDKGNPQSKAFWTKNGFELTGEEFSNDFSSKLIMERKIGTRMKIEFENIILRDMQESDIEDYVRWFTAETRWSEADAPWEPIETDEETERKGWTEYYEAVKDMPEKAVRWKFEIEYKGKHIGWVSSYTIDENYEWIAFDNIKEGQKVYRAVGIDICEPEFWAKGVGTAALRAFIDYYLKNGFDALYTQTWSGNVRMLRCAEKLGFKECNRNVGIREVDGKKYDGLTFRLRK